MTDAVLIAEERFDSADSRFSWGLAIAGGLASSAVTFVLLTLGAAVGLLLVNANTPTGPSLPGFLTGGGIYFFTVEAFGFAVGGYLTGRLLGPVVETRFQEEFRAAAHGFVAWAVGVLVTFLIAALAGTAATSLAAPSLYGGTAAGNSTLYFTDRLFDAPGRGGEPAARAEAARLLEMNVGFGPSASGDRDSLVDLVGSQTGLSRDAAASRVDAVLAVERAQATARRRFASYASAWIAFALIFGAIVASAAAVFARIEDDRAAP